MNGLETTALTKKQEEKVQVYETNLVRRIVGVMRADKRRTDELRGEDGVKENIKFAMAKGRDMKNWQRRQMLRTWRGKEGKRGPKL